MAGCLSVSVCFSALVVCPSLLFVRLIDVGVSYTHPLNPTNWSLLTRGCALVKKGTSELPSTAGYCPTLQRLSCRSISTRPPQRHSQGCHVEWLPTDRFGSGLRQRRFWSRPSSGGSCNRRRGRRQQCLQQQAGLRRTPAPGAPAGDPVLVATQSVAKLGAPGCYQGRTNHVQCCLLGVGCVHDGQLLWLLDLCNAWLISLGSITT